MLLLTAVTSHDAFRVSFEALNFVPLVFCEILEPPLRFCIEAVVIALAHIRISGAAEAHDLQRIHHPLPQIAHCTLSLITIRRQKEKFLPHASASLAHDRHDERRQERLAHASASFPVWFSGQICDALLLILMQLSSSAAGDCFHRSYSYCR